MPSMRPVGDPALELTPPDSETANPSNDEQIGRRAAYAVVVLAVAGPITVYLSYIAGLVVMLATGADPNPGAHGTGRWAIFRSWGGRLPTMAPWWYFLVVVLGCAVVLVVIWRRERWYAGPWGRHAVIFAWPAAVGLFALLTASGAHGSGSLTDGDAANYWIPTVLGVAVAVVAFARQFIPERRTRRKRRRASR